MVLKKQLGLLDLFCLASGAMISSGIFVLPGIAHALAGPSVILSYLAAGFLAGLGMLSTAELITAMPKAGGDYFYVTRTLGPAIGSISGLLSWFALSLKSSFALIGMAAFVSLFTDIDMRLLGVMLCAVFVAVNLCGTKHAGRLQILLVAGLMVLMIFFILRGLPDMESVHFQPFMPHGIHRTLATAGFVFVAFGGLVNISSVAEEVKNPGKTLPYGMMLSLVIVTILYGLMVTVTTGVLPSAELDSSLTPISDAAGVFLSPWAAGAIGLAAVFAFISTANAGIMAASRYLYALSRDELLPSGLSRLTRRSGVPVNAVFTTGLFVTVSLFLNLKVLVEAASLVLILGFVLSSVCVIVLRESHIQNYRPLFRAPLYPLPQLIAIPAMLLLLFELGIHAFIISAILFGIGFVGYWFYGRKRMSKDFALLHLLERLTARELVTGGLDRELREVVRERDEIAMDQFDALIDRAHILDFEKHIDFKAFSQMLAGELAEPLEMRPADLAQAFAKREQQGSTVLSPFLAVPHIIVKGSGKFEIILARAREGIYFSDSAPSIHAVFALVGTMDQRNLHLRSLANIAQIAHADDFEDRWMKARDSSGIRDVVLLGGRKRNQD